MRYFGGKQRISKRLGEFLNGELKEGQPFVDLFCGSCNVISKIDPDRVRLANDKHKYLIELLKGVQSGYELPDTITEQQYKEIKSNVEDKILHGFVGFGLSYSGKWWGGYCRGGLGRNYCLNAKNSLLKKFENLKDVVFSNEDYKNIKIPDNSLVYCDIPYKDTTQYSKREVGVFDYEYFYGWCKQKEAEGVSVYVSEYLKNVPDGATVVFSIESKKDIRNKDGIQEPTTEVVYRFIK